MERTPEEYQRKLRIVLTMAAYAYEFENTSIMSDALFDKLSLEVDVDMDTGNPKMDRFFKTEFSAYTGSWVQKHPELTKVAYLYRQFYAGREIVDV